MDDPVRPEDVRISDVERAAAQDRLRRAHEIGQVDLGEFDERVTAVWAARTRGDLERATADLPESPPGRGRRRLFSDTGGGITMRILTITWASTAAVTFAVWALLVLSTGIDVHPWWVWVAVPPGAALAVLYAAGIGRPPRDR